MRHRRKLGTGTTVKEGTVYQRTLNMPNGCIREYRIERTRDTFRLFRGADKRPLGAFPCIEWAHAARQADMVQNP